MGHSEGVVPITLARVADGNCVTWTARCHSVGGPSTVRGGGMPAAPGARTLGPMNPSDPPSPPGRFVPLEYIMEELSISYSQALALVRSGQLPAIKVGGRGVWRVSLDAFEDFIAERYAETAAMVTESET